MANPQTTTRSLGLSSGCSTKSYVHLDGMKWDDITDLDLIATLCSLTPRSEAALQLAEEALQLAGSLSRLVQMPANELHNLIPDSPHTVAFINLLRLGIHRIVNERTSDQVCMSSPEAMAEYVAIHRNPAMGGNRRLVLLDQDSRIIRDQLMSMSQTNLAICRNIAQKALEANAFGLIVIDYLYRDDLRFSSKSEILSELIATSLINIDVHLYDYLIVGVNRFYSKNGKTIINLYET